MRSDYPVTARLIAVSRGAGGYPSGMEEDETVELMRRRMFLADRADAERILRAVLRTLAELIEPGAAGRLAAQLPADLAAEVRPVAAPAAGPERELAGFVGRVAERAGTTEPEAIHYASVVLEVLGEVTVHIAGQLQEAVPEELRPLVAAGGRRPAGRVSAQRTVSERQRGGRHRGDVSR